MDRNQAIIIAFRRDLLNPLKKGYIVLHFGVFRWNSLRTLLFVLHEIVSLFRNNTKRRQNQTYFKPRKRWTDSGNGPRRFNLQKKSNSRKSENDNDNNNNNNSNNYNNNNNNLIIIMIIIIIIITIIRTMIFKMMVIMITIMIMII